MANILLKLPCLIRRRAQNHSLLGPTQGDLVYPMSPDSQGFGRLAPFLRPVTTLSVSSYFQRLTVSLYIVNFILTLILTGIFSGYGLSLKSLIFWRVDI